MQVTVEFMLEHVEICESLGMSPCEWMAVLESATPEPPTPRQYREAMLSRWTVGAEGDLDS